MKTKTTFLITAIFFAYTITQAQTSTSYGGEQGASTTAGTGGDNSNAYYGHLAGLNNTGSSNTLIGASAGENITSGSQNTLLGYNSGQSLTTGIQNTFLGSGSGLNSTGSGNVFLGYNAGADELGSNLLYIDNSNTGTPLIWGDFAANALRFNGSVSITNIPENITNDLTRVLVSNGAGDLFWRDATTLDSQRSNEEIQDVNGAMVTGNTETRITVTYDDTSDVLNFVVEPNLSAYTNDVGFITSPDDADVDPLNEMNTGLTLNGTILELTDNNGALSQDLDDVFATDAELAALNTDDDDADPTNEIETWATLAGIPAGFSDDVDDVIDGDANPNNEIQDLSLSADDILSLSGDVTTVDLSPYLDNTDNQTLSYDNITHILTIADGNSVDLSSLSVDEASDDQQLSLAGNLLQLEDGGNVDLSAYLDDTRLSETEVDDFVSDNGYLTDELDGDPTNELQQLQFSNGIISLTNDPGAFTIDLSGYDSNAADDFDGDFNSLSNVPADLADGDDVDDLGNHTATQNIQLGSHWLSGDGGAEGLFVSAGGNVGIGTNTPNTDALLDVNGEVIIGDVSIPAGGGYQLYVGNGILAEKVKVAIEGTGDWSDRVFENDYKLKSLSEIERFVTKNKHLPGVPSASTVVKEGIDVAKMDAKLLEKIEELMLYTIQQEKLLKQQQATIEKLLKHIENTENK